jgi:hypothetical protein
MIRPITGAKPTLHALCSLEVGLLALMTGWFQIGLKVVLKWF